MSDVIGYIINDQIVDTQSASSGDREILFDNSKEALEIIRHSAAHLMAQAIKELYPNTQFLLDLWLMRGFIMILDVQRRLVKLILKR